MCVPGRMAPALRYEWPFPSAARVLAASAYSADASRGAGLSGKAGLEVDSMSSLL